MKYILNQGKGDLPKANFTNKAYFVKVMMNGRGVKNL